MEKRGGKERENKKMVRSSGRNGKESNGKEMKDGREEWEKNGGRIEHRFKLMEIVLHTMDVLQQQLPPKLT